MDYLVFIENRLGETLTARQLKIYELLVSGKCSIKKLSNKFSLSRMTIWRELKVIKNAISEIFREDL